MAFRFQAKENVGLGVHRLLRERLDCAIERFAGGDNPVDPVHAVRKDIKKIRAILWLVRSQLKDKTYLRETDTLREIASLLAPVRDTQVHLETLEKLPALLKKNPRQNRFATVQTLLEKERDQARDSFITMQGSRKALKLLRAARERVADLKSGIAEDSWKALSPGILETYKRGKKGLQIGQTDGCSEDFHQWRKAVKRLWYQMRLISPAWPRVIGILNDELRSLGEGLGADHDLFVLQTIATEQLATAVPIKEREELVHLIAARQVELRQECLNLGERVYAEKPSQFCKRIGDYWEIWRNEAE